MSAATTTSTPARTPVPANWTPSMLPDVSGKTVIVTGAGTGLGFHTALELARHGAHVVLACHLEEQGKDAESKIAAAIQGAEIQGGKAEYMHCDVSDLASVKRFAEQFTQTHARLDVLVLNAGILSPQYKTTVDGFELEFATNYLGHFALTCQLMDVLRKNPAQARVLTVSSVLHKRAPAFNVDEIMVSDAAKFNRIQVYANTKLCVLLFSLELQRRLAAKGITNVISVGTHPGVVSTGMMDTDLSDLGLKTFMAFKIASKLMHAPEFGALPIMYAAAAPGVLGGEYYGPDGLLSIYGNPTHDVASADAQSEANAAKLWARSEEMTKLTFEL